MGKGKSAKKLGDASVAVSFEDAANAFGITRIFARPADGGNFGMIVETNCSGKKRAFPRKTWLRRMREDGSGRLADMSVTRRRQSRNHSLDCFDPPAWNWRFTQSDYASESGH
jgi:hypothetical protein